MKIFLFLFLYYWAFGMLILPMGDFSLLKDLAHEFRNCKETEDKDMTMIDFITDHLINVDSIFDKHDNGDKQKPHTPIHDAQHNTIFPFEINHKINVVKATVFVTIKTTFNYEKNNNYSYNYSTPIFHPPLA
jgi:GTP-binding protein EngB required for normal cell division